VLYYLQESYESYANIECRMLSNFHFPVANTKQEITEMRNLSNTLDDKILQSENLRSNLRDKLGKLKQSIREAREEANKVRTMQLFCTDCKTIVKVSSIWLCQ